METALPVQRVHDIVQYSVADLGGGFKVSTETPFWCDCIIAHTRAADLLSIS